MWSPTSSTLNHAINHTQYDMNEPTDNTATSFVAITWRLGQKKYNAANGVKTVCLAPLV